MLEVICVKNQIFPKIPTQNECWCSGMSEHLTKWDCRFRVMILIEDNVRKRPNTTDKEE